MHECTNVERAFAKRGLEELRFLPLRAFLTNSCGWLANERVSFAFTPIIDSEIRAGHI
jgi:hypothetical protein